MHFLKAAFQRITQQTSSANQDINYTPPSYFTRRRDGEDTPRDKSCFNQSFYLLNNSYIPSSSRSFHLEYLNRTLISHTKLTNMNIADENPCPHCKTLATQDHMINDCIFPKICHILFKQFMVDQGWDTRETLSETYWAFFWPVKTIEYRKYIQLACFWIEIKKSAHKIAQTSRFPRFRALNFQAKILTAIKMANASTKHLPNQETAQTLTHFMLDKIDSIPHHYAELLYEINRRSAPRW